MEHGGELITTIALGLSAAFLAGLIARRLKLPSIVGYLLAGVALGPFTPGLFANQDIATELAEIGVILLMFGVGIHFSFRDLLAVRGIAIPGAIVQISVATLLGVGLAVMLGWGVPAGIVLGLSLSVASTVVLLRALMQRNVLDSVRPTSSWLRAPSFRSRSIRSCSLPSIRSTRGSRLGRRCAGTWTAGAAGWLVQSRPSRR